RIEKILHFDDGALGVEDAEVDDGVHFDGDVVSRDDVLWWHVQDDGAQAYADHPVDRAKHQDDSGAFRVRQQLSHAKDHASFIFVENFDRRDQVQRDQDEDQQDWRRVHDEAPLSDDATDGATSTTDGEATGSTVRVRPSRPMMCTGAPAVMGAVATAVHS